VRLTEFDNAIVLKHSVTSKDIETRKWTLVHVCYKEFVEGLTSRALHIFLKVDVAFKIIIKLKSFNSNTSKIKDNFKSHVNFERIKR